MAKNSDNVSWAHGMADVTADLRLHYVHAGKGERTIVLLHGFPQTWWEWNRVIPRLAGEGFRVVAPDYRGAGESGRPWGGYDKCTMAGDIHRLLREHLHIEGQIILAGHDIGLMVAYAYAQAYRNEVSHLVIMDAPLPGTAVFDRLKFNPRLWHFAFNNARDVAEMLVAGRERQYLQTFFFARSFDPSAIDLETYVSAYSAPGAMRAGFELYRAFERDAEDNRDALRRNGKLEIPVLAIGGAISNSGPLLEEMMLEVASNVRSLRIPGTAHWLAEEDPNALSAALLEFVRNYPVSAQQLPTSVQARRESPFACDPLALAPQQRKRHFDELGPALRTLRKSVRELADGYEFEFPADEKTFQIVTEWAIQERLCCPFLDISVRLEPESGPLCLRLTGRPGTKDFIRVDAADWVKQ